MQNVLSGTEKERSYNNLESETPAMAIEIKLEAFEGPMDLLLHLIDKNKVNIYDIPIALITEQYMNYLSTMQALDPELDRMSEFLVMAAELLDIKSRMLLPVEKNEEGEEIDPREELVRRLIEYKTCKYMSQELRDREKNAEGALFRRKHIPGEVAAYRPPVSVDKILDEASVTLPGLYKVFQEVMKRRENLRDPIRAGFGRIEKEEFNTRETMSYVEHFIENRRRCTFRNLLMLRPGRTYVVVSFLTILELMKRGHIYVTQDENFGEIYIEQNDRSQWLDDGNPVDDEDWIEEKEENREHE